MHNVSRFYLIRSLLSWMIFAVLLGYMTASYGRTIGLQVFGLLWSAYVLCLPAAHGQLMFGIPILWFTGRAVRTELYLLLAAIATVLGFQLLAPQAFFTILPTHLLHRMISMPGLYWGVFAASAAGTLYNFMLGISYASQRKITHQILRGLLIVAGTGYFLYRIHPELIIIMNSRA